MEICFHFDGLGDVSASTKSQVIGISGLQAVKYTLRVIVIVVEFELRHSPNNLDK